MSEASLLCASGRKVRKIDLTTGLWQQDFERNQADVRLLAISPVDGNIFCSASRAGVVRMFDSRAGSVLSLSSCLPLILSTPQGPNLFGRTQLVLM